MANKIIDDDYSRSSDDGSSSDREYHRRAMVEKEEDDDGDDDGKATIASDVAVAGIHFPSSSASASNLSRPRKRRKAQGDDSRERLGGVAAAVGNERLQQRQHDAPEVTMAHPKNFAERLMRALQIGAIPDMVWWIGNGSAVAIQPKKLKKSNEAIRKHLQVKDYSAFLHSFNRWCVPHCLFSVFIYM